MNWRSSSRPGARRNSSDGVVRTEAVAATIRAAGGRAIVAKHDVTAYEGRAARVYGRSPKGMGGLDLLVYCSGAQYNRTRACTTSRRTAR